MSFKFLKTAVASKVSFRATFTSGDTTISHPCACWFMQAQDRGLDVKSARFQLDMMKRFEIDPEKLETYAEVDRILQTYEKTK